MIYILYCHWWIQIKLNLIWTNCAPISIISIFASINLNVRHVINFCEKLEDPRIPRMIRLKRCRKGCWPNDIPLSRLYNLYLSFNFPSLSKFQTLQVAFIFLYFLYSNYFICLNLKVVYTWILHNERSKLLLGITRYCHKGFLKNFDVTYLSLRFFKRKLDCFNERHCCKKELNTNERDK